MERKPEYSTEELIDFYVEKRQSQAGDAFKVGNWGGTEGPVWLFMPHFSHLPPG